MTTLSPEKKTWADAHVGQPVEAAVRGTFADSYTVLDDGRVRFTVLDGDGEIAGYVTATAPLSESEVTAQLEAQQAAAENDSAARQEEAAAAAAELQAAVDAAVEKKFADLAVAKQGQA
jgi:hypothetical protein